MRKLLSYLKPYRGRIALATLLMAVSAICDLLLPTLMADVLDKGVYGAAEADTFGYILKTAGWMLGLSLLSLGSVAWGYWVVYHVVAGYTWNLRSALFRRIHTMTLTEVGSIGASNLVTRTTHDVGTLNEVISMLCGGILIIPLMFLGGVVLCMRKDIYLSLVIICVVPLLLGAGILLSKRIEHLWEIADGQCDKQNDLVRERLRGIRVIRAFDRERHAHAKITDATRVMADNLIRANVSMEIIDPAAAFVLNTAALLIVYLGGVRMERGSGLTAGDVFAIIQYINIILGAIVSVSYDIVMLPHVRVAVKRLSQITESTALEEDRPAQGLSFSGAIDLEHVGFTYPGSSLPALSDVDVHIKPGEWVSVIGGTGSGKTTLTELLLAFRAPTEGKLRFDGQDAAKLSPKDVRANVSCSLQKSMLYAGTPWSWPRSRISCGNSPRGWTSGWNRPGPTSPAARSSASPSPGPSSRRPRSTSSTTPSPLWTSSPRPRCAGRWAKSSPGARASSSPSAWSPPCTPTGSLSCPTALSRAPGPTRSCWRAAPSTGRSISPRREVGPHEFVRTERKGEGKAPYL